jgi:outer membrane lipoprotein SlyB
MTSNPLLLRFAALAASLCVAGATLAQAPAQPARCSDCGTVKSIRYVEEQGQASGVGAVAGGVVGGVIGHQFGSGRGNTVATVAGAAGGAYAGHQIEKSKKKKAYWSVAIRMDGGNTRTFTYTEKPGVKEGEQVKLVDGGKRLALIAN